MNDDSWKTRNVIEESIDHSFTSIPLVKKNFNAVQRYSVETFEMLI